VGMVPPPDGYRCYLSGDSLAESKRDEEARVGNCGSRPRYESRRNPANHGHELHGGPRADDDEKQPLAKAQTAKQPSSGVRVRFLDSPRRVPTAPHVAAVAMNPATSRSLEAFATYGHTAPAHTAIDAAGCGEQGQSTPIGRAESPYLNSTSWAPLRCARRLTPRRPSDQHEDACRSSHNSGVSPVAAPGCRPRS
jgi:hypothetical protein